jgi:hypothetical protein
MNHKIRSKETILTCVGISIIAIMVVCPEVCGLTGGAKEYGGDVLASEAGKLKTLVKPMLALGGMGGIIMGGIQSFKQSSLGPLLTWFGVGAGSFAGYGLLGSDMFSALIPF